MKLLTKALMRQIPMLYSTEETPTEDKIVQVKFFTPDAGWTWFVFEAAAVTKEGDEITLKDAIGRADIQDILFFGFVKGLEREWGYFNFNELKTVRGKFNLPIERDLWFKPQRWGDVPDWEK